MQQCFHCGQLNEEYEDYCVYCGEALFIEVDHEGDVKMDHLYADSIANELLDENTNIFEDDIDEITRELLGETDKKEDTIIIDDEEYTYDPYEEEEKDEQLI